MSKTDRSWASDTDFSALVALRGCESRQGCQTSGFCKLLRCLPLQGMFGLCPSKSPVRRDQRQARVRCGHARELWAGREPAAPAPGTVLGRTVRGVRGPLGSELRLVCNPFFFKGHAPPIREDFHLAIGSYGQIVGRPFFFKYTISRHRGARRAATTATMATKLRPRGAGLWAYRAVSVSRFLRIYVLALP